MHTQTDSALDQQILSYLDTFQDLFCTDVCRALQETKFANRMRITPRRLDELGRSEIAAFQNYVQQPNAQDVANHGKYLAFEGLGHASIINVAAALRKAWLTIPTEPTSVFTYVLTITDAYLGSLFEGYIEGCEQEVRREQQLTHAAYLRTLDYGNEQAVINTR